MVLIALAVNFFVALFALIDPVGMAPLFAAATGGVSEAARRRVALYVSVFAFVFLCFFYFTGVAILQYFGISIIAFRIAGGVLLFRLGLAMMGDEFTPAVAAAAAEGEETLSVSASARRHFETMIVPFGMPLLIGPGSISTVVIFASQNAGLGWRGAASGVLGIFAVCLTVLLTFLASGVIMRALGKIGMTVVVKVLGLILCAMAVQFIIIGIQGATMGVIRSAVANPYPLKH